MDRTARTLASYGRNGDNNLVHVSDRELKGIEQLTGRKFTRNPDTGLPEAFNFGQILGTAAPIVAGIGGTVLSGGNPLVGAAAAGATSAAVGKAQGKSTEQALAQGLMTGITSYAGGQVLSGVGDAATQAAGQASVAAPSISSMAPEAAMASLPAAPTAASTGVPGLNASFSEGIGQKASALGDTMSNIASQPSAALSKIGENIQAKPFSALMAGAGAYSTASDLMSGAGPNIPGQTPYDPNRYPENFPTVPRTWNAPPSNYTPGIGAEYRYFAKGGIATLAPEDRGTTANIMNEAKAALLGEHPRPNDAIERFRDTFGSDALSVLKDRITGGRVRGAGGGMDDLIPGTIEGRQKVRLADGEFVVPSDVVSGIGDGSTDQGVRKLHEMMNKVRQQRTGKTAQPKAIGGKISL